MLYFVRLHILPISCPHTHLCTYASDYFKFPRIQFTHNKAPFLFPRYQYPKKPGVCSSKVKSQSLGNMHWAGKGSRCPLVAGATTLCRCAQSPLYTHNKLHYAASTTVPYRLIQPSGLSNSLPCFCFPLFAYCICDSQPSLRHQLPRCLFSSFTCINILAP